MKTTVSGYNLRSSSENMSTAFSFGQVARFVAKGNFKNIPLHLNRMWSAQN